MPSSVLRLSVTALLLSLAGCIDNSFERPGTWQPAGVNDRNLRAMIADPDDLERGSAALRERGAAGANAATRLLTEQRRALPVTSSRQVGGQAATAQDRPLPGLGISAGGGGGAAAAGAAR